MSKRKHTHVPPEVAKTETWYYSKSVVEAAFRAGRHDKIDHESFDEKNFQYWLDEYEKTNHTE